MNGVGGRPTRRDVAALLSALVAMGCGRIGFDNAGAAPDGPLSDGLLLHFAFDVGGLLIDRARGHDAKCTACPGVAADAQRGSVAVFDATSQCLHVDDAAELRPARFTVAAWISRRGPGGGGAVFVRPRDATSFEEAIELFFNQTSSSWGVDQKFFNEPAVTPDSWHHVAGTYDGATAILYIDGAAVETGPAGPVTYVPGDALHIGCDFDFGNDLDWWEGSLDDVRFYDRALTAAEIDGLTKL